jgi:two-component system chemotaxis response regulator CheB
MTEKIRVLVVDDSPLFRRIVSDILESHPQIEVVGTASNGKIAQYQVFKLDPDVITLDIEMPELNGLEFLKWLMSRSPKPVIMMSVLTQEGKNATFQALEYGAFDFVPKPSSNAKYSFDDLEKVLIPKVLAAQNSKYLRKNNQKIEKISLTNGKETMLEKQGLSVPGESLELSRAGREEKLLSDEIEKLTYKKKTIPDIPNFGKGAKSSFNFILIGTSTGGPNALMKIVKQFPQDLPVAVLIVQHMPPVFTREFANRLNNQSKLRIKEAEDGDAIEAGQGFVAPGNWHMKIVKKNQNFFISLDQTDLVNGHRPSIDALFNSAAPLINSKENVIGIIMTGMGKDGALGLKNLKERGAFCLAQDKESSVVFGMNREAVKIQAVDTIANLEYLLPIAISKL